MGIAMPAEEREAKLAELKKSMADGEEEHNALLKQLQATFKESQEKLESRRTRSKRPVLPFARGAGVPAFSAHLIHCVLLLGERGVAALRFRPTSARAMRMMH